MAANMADLLQLMVDRGASDLHITSGTYPQIRVNGRLNQLTQFEVLTPQDTQRLSYSVLNEGQKQKFEEENELDHPPKQCLVNQREVFADTQSFTKALKSILRQDPDVVLVGEMRDLETIAAALTIAETGHLTFGTLHTNSCAQTMNRIIDVFP